MNRYIYRVDGYSWLDEEEFSIQNASDTINGSFLINNITLCVNGKEGNSTGSLEYKIHDGTTWHDWDDMIEGTGNTTVAWHNITVDTSSWNITIDDWDDIKIRFSGQYGTGTESEKKTSIYGMRTSFNYNWTDIDDIPMLNFTWTDMSQYIENSTNYSNFTLCYNIYVFDSPVSNVIYKDPYKTNICDNYTLFSFDESGIFYFYITVVIYIDTLGAIESSPICAVNTETNSSQIYILPLQFIGWQYGDNLVNYGHSGRSYANAVSFAGIDGDMLLYGHIPDFGSIGDNLKDNTGVQSWFHLQNVNGYGATKDDFITGVILRGVDLRISKTWVEKNDIISFSVWELQYV